MHIAFVVAKYFEFGGMQRTMRRIAEELMKRGHQLEFFCLEWQGDTIYNSPIHQITCKRYTNHGRMKQFSNAWLAIRSQSNFDCVVGFNKLAGLDVYYAGDPCLAALLEEKQSHWITRTPRYKTYLNLEKAVFESGQNTEILLISHNQKSKFQQYYQTEEQRFHLLPPGIQQDRLRPPPSAEEIANLHHQLGIEPQDRLLLTIGSGFKTKGVDRVIIALAALPEEEKQRVHYLVVGEGNVRPMKRLAKKLGVSDRVHFLGSQKKVSLYYYGAYALIHPARTENTGTTLLEAMICGLPILTTANCGFSHYVEEANAGQVLPHPFVAEDLSSALLLWLSSDKTPHWSQNGERFTMHNDLYSLIEKSATIIENTHKND